MNIEELMENARLKGRVIALEAEVQTLTAELRCLEAVIRSHERVDCLTVTKLKAEVERLRKAGDTMAREICILGPVDDKEKKVIDDWNAAKEGKQFV